MNNEEKILALLEKHSEVLTQMHADQKEMKDDINGLQSGLKSLDAGQTAMRDDIKGLQSGLASVKLRLELDVEKRFDAVNEGIDAILEQMASKSRVDELEADVVVLKTAVKTLAHEVAELKKAQ